VRNTETPNQPLLLTENNVTKYQGVPGFLSAAISAKELIKRWFGTLINHMTAAPIPFAHNAQSTHVQMRICVFSAVGGNLIHLGVKTR